MSLNKLLEKKLKELDEMSTIGTTGSEEYNSKYAFSDDEDDEKERAEQGGYKKVAESKFKKLAKSTFLKEASYKEYKRDDSLRQNKKLINLLKK